MAPGNTEGQMAFQDKKQTNRQIKKHRGQTSKNYKEFDIAEEIMSGRWR